MDIGGMVMRSVRLFVTILLIRAETMFWLVP
jgi:hypothetical protein